MDGMQQVFKSFGLALVGTMHPKILWLSLRPFLIVSILWGSLIWLSWTPALEMLSVFLTTSLFTIWRFFLHHLVCSDLLSSGDTYFANLVGTSASGCVATIAVGLAYYAADVL